MKHATTHALRCFTACLLLAGIAHAEDAPAAKPAPSKFTPEQQVVMIYEKLCVKSGGKYERAIGTLKELETKNTVKAVPEEQAKKLFEPGIKAYASKTPAGVPIFISYDPVGICGVHVMKANDKALKAEFVQFVTNIKGAMKATLFKKAEDKPQGASFFTYYVLSRPGAKKGLAFGLSTSPESAKQSPQHLLTFNLAQPE